MEELASIFGETLRKKKEVQSERDEREEREERKRNIREKVKKFEGIRNERNLEQTKPRRLIRSKVEEAYRKETPKGDPGPLGDPVDNLAWDITTKEIEKETGEKKMRKKTRETAPQEQERKGDLNLKTKENLFKHWKKLREIEESKNKSTNISKHRSSEENKTKGENIKKDLYKLKKITLKNNSTAISDAKVGGMGGDWRGASIETNLPTAYMRHAK